MVANSGGISAYGSPEPSRSWIAPITPPLSDRSSSTSRRWVSSLTLRQVQALFQMSTRLLSVLTASPRRLFCISYQILALGAFEGYSRLRLFPRDALSACRAFDNVFFHGRSPFSAWCSSPGLLEGRGSPCTRHCELCFRARMPNRSRKRATPRSPRGAPIACRGRAVCRR